MTIREQKAEAKRRYALGWVQDDNYEWRCGTCGDLMQEVECSCELCKGGCEWCLGRKEPEK